MEDMQSFMANALAHETDELRRLGILAARIYLLRNRVAKLKEFNRDPELPSIPKLDTTTPLKNVHDTHTLSITLVTDIRNSLDLLVID